jgi:hypothetical protein
MRARVAARARSARKVVGQTRSSRALPVLTVCIIIIQGTVTAPLCQAGKLLFLLVTRGGVTLLAGHTHQPDESDCGGLQHCCH